MRPLLWGLVRPDGPPTQSNQPTQPTQPPLLRVPDACPCRDALFLTVKHKCIVTLKFSEQDPIFKTSCSKLSSARPSVNGPTPGPGILVQSLSHLQGTKHDAFHEPPIDQHTVSVTVRRKNKERKKKNRSKMEQNLLLDRPHLSSNSSDRFGVVSDNFHMSLIKLQHLGFITAVSQQYLRLPSYCSLTQSKVRGVCVCV